MKRFFSLFILLALVTTTMPVSAQAADFEVSGWIPYWKSTEGTKDAKKHLSELTEVNPFAYSVTSNGDLKDLAGLKKSVWKNFFKAADKKDVRIIPTIMWSDTNNIHRILSDSDLREDHIDEIVNMVKKGKYDGVDIDYEAKLAATRPYFSTFLKELDEELGTKMLACTIEARTPPDSLYRTIPANLEYANDYKEINTYCDRVRIMAYDQQRADIKLNDARSGSPYMPVADPAWAEKVIQLALKDIDEDKLVLAVPTYGFEYTLTVSPNWYQNYARQWSVTDAYAKDLADDLNIEPMRNAAGELSFSYISTTTPSMIPRSTRAPSGTPEGNEAAARALAYANATGATTQVNLVWWTDAEAVERKVDLAKKYGLRGIAIFRVDGTEDQDIWDLF
ncbi:hypothetical protein K2Y00_04095 [Patescibacteria group bacterium]|nr:hypothetical protein [Patescibacteria group bacterium]